MSRVEGLAKKWVRKEVRLEGMGIIGLNVLVWTVVVTILYLVST